MAFARERCLPTNFTLCPTDGKVSRGTNATAIRTPKPRPGILSRQGDGGSQRQDRERGKNQGEYIAVAVQHRLQLRRKTDQIQARKELVLLGFAFGHVCAVW